MSSAAYGGAEAGAKLGNQIFVTIQEGDVYPPRTCCVRIKYSQTLRDVRMAVQKELGVPVESQQLFRHGTELLAEEDSRTLMEMQLHTGFSLKGYDMVLCLVCSSLPHLACLRARFQRCITIAVTVLLMDIGFDPVTSLSALH